MPYPTRWCAIIDFYTSIICHVIQREYRNNTVSDDIDTGCNVKFSDSKVDTKKSDSSLCMGKVSHYYYVVSISVVDFIDKQRIDIYLIFFSVLIVY